MFVVVTSEVLLDDQICLGKLWSNLIISAFHRSLLRSSIRVVDVSNFREFFYSELVICRLQVLSVNMTSSRIIFALLTFMSVATSSVTAGDYCSSLIYHKCDNDKCVLLQWVCDGEDDCGDASDEQLCAPHQCSDDEFMCGNKVCVPRSWRCDGDSDCDDHSDEASCGDVKCPEGFMSCGQNATMSCIPHAWMCDGHHDCPSGIDEHECANKTCASGDFQCHQDGSCISERWVCDGDNDCQDGSDESGCAPVTCPPGQWQCANNSLQCIPEAWHCDGSFDCMDHSDEVGCSKPGHIPAGDECHNDGEFRCRISGECIHRSWVCDMDHDCSDGSDEEQCLEVTCLPHYFQCHSDHRCIPQHMMCDGVSHCVDGSDELGCLPRRRDCDPRTEFDCSRMMSDNCIRLDAACDGIVDCHNKEDENATMCANRTISECLRNNGGCSHECISTYIGHYCSCPDGFQLNADERTCTDIDECKIPGHCSQICENRMGSFKCSCRPGYYLDPEDQATCRAITGEPTLLFANRHDLRQLHLSTGRYNLVVGGMHSAIAVDYDIGASAIFWSDVTSENISRVTLDNTGATSAYEVLVTDDLHTPDGLAYDWVHRNLYWTDAGKDRIEVLSLYGTGSRWRRTLIDVGLDQPRAIVVDPREKHRAMYWTDWGSKAKIEKSFLDGSKRHAIIDQNIEWPNGLTLDSENNRLLWVDAKLHVIFTSDLEGGNRHVLLTSLKYLEHPFSIAVFEEFIYWTDWKAQAILKVSHVHGPNINDTHVQRVASDLVTPMDVRIYHRLKQPRVANVCENATCSHLCLPTIVAPGYTCACPSNQPGVVYTLRHGTTCVMDSGSAYIPTTLPYSATDGKELLGPSSMSASNNQGDDLLRATTSDHSDTLRSESRIGQSRKVIAITVSISAIVFVLVVLLAVIFIRRAYRQKNIKSMNFDNPVYRKTTAGEDTFSLDKHLQQSSRIPTCHQSPLLQPLNSSSSDSSPCV